LISQDYPQDAWQLLSPQLNENRRQRMSTTAAQRTSHIRLIVQDVHQPHNVSACIRSAEAFGIQNVDVVSLTHKFNASSVAKGVDEWIDITKHASVDECIKSLHQSGYLVAAAFPHGNAITLDQLPVDKPIAVAFGNEHEGLDLAWRNQADMCFTIPMFGIVESLNISVCAAITLHNLTTRARKLLPPSQFLLSKAEQEKLLNKWICRQITSWSQQLPRLRQDHHTRS
jgi:tRNA (guanosine-2'-O-)-methyltransferase